jgi:hypothetical protein
MSAFLAQFQYRHDAEYARGFLQDAGIASILSADDAGGLHLGLGFSRPARLLVSEEDLERARQVLRDAGVLEDGNGANGDEEGADEPPAG